MGDSLSYLDNLLENYYPTRQIVMSVRANFADVY